MMLYLSIGVALFALAFLRLLGVIEERHERALVLCLTILAFAFSWARWQTGTDWDKYIGHFEDMTSIAAANAQKWWGPAYSYIAVLVNSWGGDYSAFLFIIAAIQYTALYHWVTRSSAAPLVTVFILFCGNFYGIYFVREDVSAVFFLGFLYLYYRKQYVAACVAGAAAVAFHISAVIPIGLVFFIVRFRWAKIMAMAPFAAAGTYFVLQNLSWSGMKKILPVLGYFGSGFVEVKESDLSTTERAFLKLAFLLAIVLVCGYWLRGRNREGTDPGWSSFCVQSALVILVFTAVLLPLSQIVARFTEFAFPLLAVALANYEFRFRRITVDGAAYVCLLLMFFVELSFLYGGYAAYYYPVNTILTR